MKKYKSLFLSDIHLGSRHSNAKELFKLLEGVEFDNLFLVGDVFSIGARENHSDVIKFKDIINTSNYNIIYILGNHEKDRKKLPQIKLYQNNIEINPLNDYIYKDKIYLTHGDTFHDKDIFNKILKHLLIQAKIKAKKHIAKRKSPDSSKSSSIYHSKIKPLAQKFLHNSYINYLIKLAKKNHCHTVICGHIHLPERVDKNSVTYLNCGDWVKYNSYILEDLNGKLMLINSN